jgi:hypothetical protein
VSAHDNLGPQFGPSGTHLGFTDAASWDDRHTIEHSVIKREQYLGQVGVAKKHISAAKAARQAGDMPRAVRAMQSAASARHVASRMPQ